jgi:hypothetical protein
MMMATCSDGRSSATAGAWALDRESGLKPDLDDMEIP